MAVIGGSRSSHLLLVTNGAVIGGAREFVVSSLASSHLLLVTNGAHL